MQTLNCPNCGAPITGERCEYCGAVFYDWATISDEAPQYIKKLTLDNQELKAAVQHNMELVEKEQLRQELRFRDGIIYGLKYATRCNGVSGGEMKEYN